MTDINRWDELVQVVKLRCRSFVSDEWQDFRDKPVFSEYIQVPLDPYHMGHIVGMLARSECNGDWYHELLSIMIVGMDKAGIETLTNNFGDVFRLKDMRTGKLEINKDE